MHQLNGREVVIVDAVRTPIGKGDRKRGYYKDVHPADLLGATYRDLVDRSGIDPAAVDGVIAGCVQQMGEQTLNIGRTAWLQAGLPQEASATTLDYQCGSGQQAVSLAAAMVATGMQDVVIGAGVEHMGRVSFRDAAAVQEEFGEAFGPGLLERYPVRGQGIGAELLAEKYGTPREELDELALRSHQRAHAATQSGAFRREIAPFAANGDLYEADQGIRPTTTLEALAGLKPVFKQDGVITAGNASQISDGAAAVLLTTREKAEELGLTARARIVDHVTVGCDPVVMLEGPLPSTRTLLDRQGMEIGDIDRYEVNEAFAPVVAAWIREFGADPERVNPRGGAMALGHPLGSSGARLITSLLHGLEDDDQERGLVTMCCGGGLGIATLVERV